MSDTTFVNKQTIIEATWCQDVNDLRYKEPSDGGGAAALPIGNGRTQADKNAEFVSVKDFGAVGDGVTDDTAAIQAAITSVCTLYGKSLYFPPGTYIISDQITIPFSTGWRIFGASRASTIINQTTNNKPIFRFAAALTHSWTIETLSFDYSVQQGPSNTLAIPIYFALDSGDGPSGYFNFKITDCSFSNCFRAIASRGDSGSISVWGWRITGCQFNGSMTGAAIYFVPSPAVGQPNCRIDSVYINCQASSETSIRVSNSDNIHLDTVEFNSGSNYGSGKVQLHLDTCTNVVLTSCKSEQASIASSGSLWLFSNSRVIASGILINGLSVAAAAVVRLINADTNGTLILNGMGVTADSIGAGSSVGLFSATDVRYCAAVTVPTSPSGFIKQIAGDTAPRLDFDLYQADRGTNRGDVSVTLSSTDTKLQYFNTPLTANRTITLPSSGLYAGLTFTIVRWGLGAFTLQVIDPVSGKNTTIPSATRGSVTYRANSTGEWLPIQYSTFV